MESNSRLYAVIDGRVQGVGFRYYVMENADTLRLTGWVRNTYRGEVEVLAEGPRPDLEQLLNLLRQGPGAAFVSKVRFEWQPAGEGFSQFSVLPTA